MSAVVEDVLPLIDHAEDLVVHDDRDDRQLLAHCGAGFVQVHVEGTVACEVDDPAVRLSEAGADSSAVAESHGAQAAAGDEALGLLVTQILGCPHLVLADICDIDGILIRHVSHDADDLARVQIGRRALDVAGLRLPAHGQADPFAAVLLLDLREEGSQEFLDVCRDAEVYENVLIDLAGVDVHMDLLGSASESLRIEGDSVAETSAQSDQKICAVHGLVCGDAAVHAAHSQAAGVIVTDASCGHKCICSRAVSFFH